MANYAKRWNPPAIAPSGNTVTQQMLDDWITIMLDIDSNLLEAGLVRSDAEDQLVIDEVSVYPAINTFAGFKEYVWEGDKDVTIRLDMGVGNDGANGTTFVDYTNVSNTPYIKVTIDYDGQSSVHYCPAQIATATITVSNPSIVTLGDMTCAVRTDDFFAFMYQCNSRGKIDMSGASGSYPNRGRYRGATLAFILQRTDDGLVVMHHNMSSAGSDGDFTNTTDVQTGSMVRFLTSRGVESSALGLQRMGVSSARQVDVANNVIFQPCFYKLQGLNEFRLIPNVVSYNTADIPAGAEVEFDVGGGVRNFICLGNGNTMGAYNHGTYSALAIPFENDEP